MNHSGCPSYLWPLWKIPIVRDCTGDINREAQLDKNGDSYDIIQQLASPPSTCYTYCLFRVECMQSLARSRIANRTHFHSNQVKLWSSHMSNRDEAVAIALSGETKAKHERRMNKGAGAERRHAVSDRYVWGQLTRIIR